MSKYPELKRGLRIIDKEGKTGCVAVDNAKGDSKVAIAYVESYKVFLKVVNKEDITISACIENPKVKCAYTGKNIYAKDLNCTYCKILKEEEHLNEL